jgi:hypothetical protein
MRHRPLPERGRHTRRVIIAALVLFTGVGVAACIAAWLPGGQPEPERGVSGQGRL